MVNDEWANFDTITLAFEDGYLLDVQIAIFKS